MHILFLYVLRNTKVVHMGKSSSTSLINLDALFGIFYAFATNIFFKEIYQHINI